MIKAKKNYTIGIDIGGTNMSAVLFNGEKGVADFTLATPKDTVDHLLIMLKALIEPLEEKAKTDKMRISGVGVGIAGVLDSSGRKMLHSPNMEFINNVNLAEKFEESIGLPLFLDNDTNCFTRAEATLGAGRGYKNIYGITIGTGIGSGWWNENNIYQGAHRGANEIDAMIVDFDSGLNLEESYHKLMQNNPGKMSQESILGDPLAEKAFEEFGLLLGIALSNIVNILNPEIFVLGGGVIASSDLFLSTAKKEMKQHINSPEATKRTRVVKTKLKNQAGPIGAALLVK